MSDTGGEVITIFVGQAGVQVGNACWELFCLEHGIGPDGFIVGCHNTDDNSYQTFFSQSQSGKYVPRSIIIDSEPTVIDKIRMGGNKYLFDPSLLITGREDAANNFARGYYTIGQEMVDLVLERIQIVCEACTNLTAFMIFRSVGGGTGSGLATLLLERMSNEFEKLPTLDFSIYPAPNLSSTIVEPYNAVLTTHCSMDYEDCCFVIDNEALYEICARNLDIDRPTYTNLNRIEAQVVSAITASLRFEGLSNVGLDELQTNLVPYPRIHFPLMTYSPITTDRKADSMDISVSHITNECFRPNNQMVKCDPRKGVYMSCCLLYRGNVTLNDVNKVINMIKEKKTIQFANWTPPGFKIGINYHPPRRIPHGDLGNTDKSVVMLCNNTIIRETWIRLLRKYDLMYNKKAFVHHYINEGMDENVFVESREDITTLIQDYREVVSS